VADSGEATGLRWAALTAADVGALALATFDAKGDLIVASAADTAARLAVGSDGQVLTADSAESTGVKWAAASGGSGSGLGLTPVSGRWSAALPGWGRGGGSNLALGTGDMCGVLFEVASSCSIDRVATDVAVAGGAGGKLRAMLYAVTSSTDTRPGALISDYGQIASDDGTGTHTWTVSSSLTAGTVYCLAVAAQTAGCSLRVTETYDPRATMSAFPGGTVAVGGYAKASVTGTPPDPWGTPLDEVPVRLAVRFA
jgi:hypothetical protein